MVPLDSYGVHASHCCAKHGCKYGNDECPVANKIIKQMYPCEDCGEDERDAKRNHDMYASLGQYYKLGLDIHGVIDADPKFFAFLSKTTVAAGGEVHVITGARITDRLKEKLEKFDITYTHLFSIADHNKDACRYDEKGNPWLPDEVWDRSKAEYCAKENINLHIDDSDKYGLYFTTPYLRYYKGKGV